MSSNLIAPLHNLSLHTASVDAKSENAQDASITEEERQIASDIFSTLISSWKGVDIPIITNNQALLSQDIHRLAGIDISRVNRNALDMRRKVFNQKVLEVDGRHASPMFSREHLQEGQTQHSSYHVANGITSPILGCMMHPKGKSFGIVGDAKVALEDGWSKFRQSVNVISATSSLRGEADYGSFFDVADTLMLFGKASMTCVPERDSMINAYDSTLRDVDVNDKSVRFKNKLRRALANHARVLHAVLHKCATEDNYRTSEDSEKRHILDFLNAQCCAATDRNNVSELAYEAMTDVVSDVVTQSACREYYINVRKLFDPRPRNEKDDTSDSREVLRNKELLRWGSTKIAESEWKEWKKTLERSQSSIMNADTKLKLFSQWFRMLIRVASRSNIDGDAMWYGTSCMNMRLLICMENSASNWRCYRSTAKTDAHNKRIAAQLSDALESMDTLAQQMLVFPEEANPPPPEEMNQEQDGEYGDRQVPTDEEDAKWAKGLMDGAIHISVYRSAKRAGAVTRSQTAARLAWEAEPHSIPADGIVFVHPDDEEGDTRDSAIVEACELVIRNSKLASKLSSDIVAQIEETENEKAVLFKEIEEMKLALAEDSEEQISCSFKSDSVALETPHSVQTPAQNNCNVGAQGEERAPKRPDSRRVRRAKTEANKSLKRIAEGRRKLIKLVKNAKHCAESNRAAKVYINERIEGGNGANEESREENAQVQALSESSKSDHANSVELAEAQNTLENAANATENEGGSLQDFWMVMGAFHEQLEETQAATAASAAAAATAFANESASQLKEVQSVQNNHATNAALGAVADYEHAKVTGKEKWKDWFLRVYEGASNGVFVSLNWLRVHIIKAACKHVWNFAKRFKNLVVNGLTNRSSAQVYITIAAEYLSRCWYSTLSRGVWSRDDPFVYSMITGVFIHIATMYFDTDKLSVFSWVGAVTLAYRELFGQLSSYSMPAWAGYVLAPVQGAKQGIDNVLVAAGIRTRIVPGIADPLPDMNSWSLVAKVVISRLLGNAILSRLSKLGISLSFGKDSFIYKGAKGFASISKSVNLLTNATIFTHPLVGGVAKGVGVVFKGLEMALNMYVETANDEDHVQRTQIAFSSDSRYLYHLPIHVAREMANSMVHRYIVSNVWGALQTKVLPMLPNVVSTAIEAALEAPYGTIGRNMLIEVANYIGYSLEWIKAQLGSKWQLILAFLVLVSVFWAIQKNRYRKKRLTSLDLEREAKMPRRLLAPNVPTTLNLNAGEIAMAVAFMEMAVVSA